MDDPEPMAKTRRRAERIEPALRRKGSRQGPPNLKPTQRDRASPNRSGGGRSAPPGRGKSGGTGRSGRIIAAQQRAKTKRRGSLRRALRVTLIGLVLVLVGGGAVIAYRNGTLGA